MVALAIGVTSIHAMNSKSFFTIGCKRKSQNLEQESVASSDQSVRHGKRSILVYRIHSIYAFSNSSGPAQNKRSVTPTQEGFIQADKTDHTHQNDD